MTVRPLVHVGYHKTASSWLQQRLFGRAEGGFRLFPRGVLANALVEPHPLTFDASSARAQIDPWQEEVARNGLVPVFSHERLSGYPHSGGFDSREIAERLAAVLPQARILVVIREQRSLILSNYHQYIRDGGASPLSRYLDPPQVGHRRMPGFAAEFFQYERLIDCYRSLFGSSDVLVLLYEEFRTDPNMFVRRINDFVGVDGGVEEARAGEVLNPSPSVAALAVLRWANLLFRAGPLNPSPLVPSRPAAAVATRLALAVDRLPLRALSTRRLAREQGRIRGRVDGLYEAGNAHLSEALDVDLRRRGYAVPSP